MAYATRDDLAARFGETALLEMSDLDRLGVENTDAIERALLSAQAEIDGYLAVRYSLPLVEVPPLLVGVAQDIAWYELARTCDRVADQVRTNYEDAVLKLKGLSNGTIKLVLPQADAETTVTASPKMRFSGSRQTFTDRMLGRY